MVILHHQRWPQHINRRCRRFETARIPRREHQNAPLKLTKAQRYAVASVCERKCFHHLKTKPVITVTVTTKHTHTHIDAPIYRIKVDQAHSLPDQSAQIKMKHNQIRSMVKHIKQINQTINWRNHWCVCADDGVNGQPQKRCKFQKFHSFLCPHVFGFSVSLLFFWQWFQNFSFFHPPNCSNFVIFKKNVVSFDPPLLFIQF